MGEMNHIQLHLQQGQDTSALKRQVYKEELERINSENPMGEGELNVEKSYITNLGDKLEVGFFIRSTVVKELSLEVIKLGVVNEKDEIIVQASVDLKGKGTIPPYSGVPFEISFNLPEGTVIDNSEKLSLKFVEPEKLFGFKSVKTEIENMPEGLSFEQEKEILDFAHNLATLKADQFSVSTFKLNEDDKGNIEVILLLRNGYSKNIKIQAIPISVVNENGELVSSHIFNFNEEKFGISAQKSKIVKFLIPKNEIILEKFDIEKCTVVFK